MKKIDKYIDQLFDEDGNCRLVMETSGFSRVRTYERLNLLGVLNRNKGGEWGELYIQNRPQDYSLKLKKTDDSRGNIEYEYYQRLKIGKARLEEILADIILAEGIEDYYLESLDDIINIISEHWDEEFGLYVEFADKRLNVYPSPIVYDSGVIGIEECQEYEALTKMKEIYKAALRKFFWMPEIRGSFGYFEVDTNTYPGKVLLSLNYNDSAEDHDLDLELRAQGSDSLLDLLQKLIKNADQVLGVITDYSQQEPKLDSDGEEQLEAKIYKILYE